MRSVLLLGLLSACSGPAAFDPTGKDGPHTDAADTDGDTLPSETDPFDTDDGSGTDDTDPSDTDDGPDACTCDDQDPCTTDVCLPGGGCRFDAWSGDPLDLFDVDAILDPSTLDLQVLSTRTVLDGLVSVRVQEIRYTSWQSEGCVQTPVRVEGWLAMPSSAVGRAGATPGLAVAHGLGGYADEPAARGPAADHGVVSLAWSGPGQGASEGWGSEPDHLFDVLDSPADSWFWEHAVAGMRAVTVLSTLPEVDDTRLGMTGYSGGAVATLLVNGVDPRLKIAVPVSGTGFLDLAARNQPPGWEVDLLAGMTVPETPDGPRWQAFEASMDPRHFLASAHARTWLVNGVQDEFFPITSTASTYAALAATPAGAHLTSVREWDHGWFALFDTERPLAEIDAAVAQALATAFSPGSAPVPPTPVLVDVVDGVCAGPTLCVVAVVSVPASGYTVLGGSARVSLDGLAYLSVDLKEAAGFWVAELPWTSTADIGLSKAAWQADVELRRGAFGRTFHVSTPPRLPPGFQPAILDIAGPLP